jgi:hypothetical protein
VRVRVKIRLGPGRTTEPHLFSDVFERRQPIWPSVLASAMAHVLALALLPALVEVLSSISYERTLQASYTLEPLRLELPDRIYLPPTPPRPKAKSKAERPAAPARHSEQIQAAAPSGAPPRASLPEQFELPPTPSTSNRAPVILQPDFVTLPPPPLPAAPPLAFWTRASRPAVLRRIFTPGSAKTPPAPPKLDTPPVLGPSNLQPAVSDIAATLAAVQTAPKLPLPNSSTNPVRMRGESAAEIASFDVPQGDPLNLIYLGADISAATHVEIPRGVQNTPRSDAGAGTGTTTGRAPGDGEKPAGSTAAARDRATPGAGSAGRVPAAESAAGTATAARTPGAAANGASSGVSQQKGVAAANSPQGNSPPGVNPSDHPPAPTGAHPPDPVQASGAGVIRTTHASNGNFDVVILQSVRRDDLPEVGATLSGNPVYTVYLSVGDAREWLLEYCIPASVNPRANSYMVNIDDPGVVSAPYPLSTAIPKSIFELPHPKNIVLHGLLSAAGTLHEVKAPNMDNALVHDILTLLSQWLFRPASRNKVPVEVEVLLIIPPRT